MWDGYNARTYGSCSLLFIITTIFVLKHQFAILLGFTLFMNYLAIIVVRAKGREVNQDETELEEKRFDSYR